MRVGCTEHRNIWCPPSRRPGGQNIGSAIPKGWFPHCSAFSSLNSCGPFNDPIRCHHGPKEGPLRAFGLPDGGPRLRAVPPKSSVAAHPPGGDPGKDQHLDLWEVLSPWNPALLKTTDRGIDRIGSNELDRASLRGGARAPAPNGDVGRRQLRLERGRPPEAR